MNDSVTDRLESWKEIASFIGRDDRTAMRWEEKGMPVRRDPGGRVYASRAEIQQWLDRHTAAALDAEEATEKEGFRSRAAQDESSASHEEPSEVPKEVHKEVEEALPRLTRKRSTLLAVGIVAVALGVVFLGVWSVASRGARIGPPVRVSFTADSIEALDAQGHTIWQHKYPRPLELSLFKRVEPLEDLVRIADLKGDGNREVLVVAPFRTGNNPEDEFWTEVDCFSSDGKLLWSWVPEESFEFGKHELRGPWIIYDLIVSQRGGKHSIYVEANHHLWGNAFVSEIDPSTGKGVTRFVNSGIIYRLSELKIAQTTYLLAGGFNNEHDGGSLAVMDESRPFAASPQTDRTRHKCDSCPEGSPDYYFVFPRSEINRLLASYEDPIRFIIADEEGIQVSKAELAVIGGPDTLATFYTFAIKPGIRPTSLRFDSNYDMRHAALQKEGKLDHGLDKCPERLHPEPVRMWTPAGGWTEIKFPPMKATD